MSPIKHLLKFTNSPLHNQNLLMKQGRGVKHALNDYWRASWLVQLYQGTKQVILCLRDIKLSCLLFSKVISLVCYSVSFFWNRCILVKASNPDKQIASALDVNLYYCKNIENFIDNIFTLKVLIVFLQHFHQTLVF